MPLEQADQLDEGQSRVHMCLVTAMILEQSPDITREAVGRALDKAPKCGPASAGGGALGCV